MSDHQFKRGDKVRVKGEDFSYPAVVVKRLASDDEPKYLIKDVSIDPPMNVEEYERYLKRRR